MWQYLVSNDTDFSIRYQPQAGISSINTWYLVLSSTTNTMLVWGVKSPAKTMRLGMKIQNHHNPFAKISLPGPLFGNFYWLGLMKVGLPKPGKKEVIYRSIGFYDNTRNNSIIANQKTHWPQWMFVPNPQRYLYTEICNKSGGSETSLAIWSIHR